MEKYSTTAKVIDGTLILTLPDAIKPVVWQMQLGQTKSSALEVREQGDTWMLILKTPRADVMEIAPFATRDAAVKALLAVSRAMEKAQGHLNAPADGTGYPVPAVIKTHRYGLFFGLLRGVFHAFLALLLLIALIAAALWLIRPSNDAGFDMPAAQIQGSAEDAAPAPSAPVGTSQSAEDFLNNQ